MSKLRLASQVVLSFILAGVLVSAVFFGTSILRNLHLQYIGYLSKDVVTLLVNSGGGGTGFVTTSKSGKIYILTNDHICRAARDLPMVAIYRGDKYIVNKIKSYEDNDLCLVEAPSTAKSGFRLANWSALRDRAYAVGHPLLEEITVTEGELSTNLTIEMPIGYNFDPKDCAGKRQRLIESDPEDLFAVIFGVRNMCFQSLDVQSATIPILPGNSGSPVLNMWGSVVAVIFAGNDTGIHVSTAMSYH
jgi:S1-C subfamily serine protease